MRLRADRVSAGYGDRLVLREVDLAIPDGQVTAIVGPNASGKSTLIRTLARLLTPRSGQVSLDGVGLAQIGTKQVARQIGYLPQSPVAPDGIRVRDIVARGRYPHQSLLRQWSPADEAAVTAAMVRTEVADLADRDLAELSGGQRQRVWLALTLAQHADILLLDEPTTYLDLAHQIDVLDLCRSLASEGHTVVAVLHELGLAFRYADHVVVMSEGRIVAEGSPAAIVTADLISEVFGVACRIIPDPETGTPLVIPLRW